MYVSSSTARGPGARKMHFGKHFDEMHFGKKFPHKRKIVNPGG
jgi:hypothetical protein